ncbi:MAG: Crp/Fnr family transcriptional regulator [Rhodobiaceae bacterium]|nr:Crp/Fnr family transcriptional regulator [Rhodobiaceae bacterium]
MITIMCEPFSRLFEDAKPVRLDAGTSLFRSGTPVTTIYRVRSGTVHLVRHTRQGASLILHRARTGTILAEASAFSERYHCDADVAETVVLDALPKARFLERLAADPDLAVEWAKRLAHAVQAARFRAEIRSLKRVSDRLDAWLDDGNTLPEMGRWQEVAAELSITREALYRELSRRRTRSTNS